MNRHAWVRYLSMYLMLLTIIFSSAACAQQNRQDKQQAKAHKLVSKEVTYKSGNTTMKGYIVYDASMTGKRPGIIVVHEWWGLNDYPKKRADMLAELGYTAFAIDMYGDGKTAENPQDAQKYAAQVMQNPKDAGERFNSALSFLKQNEFTDPSNISAVGYCFGGSVVLAMARMGTDLRSVASFHGSLAPVQQPAQKGTIKSAVLVCHGGADNFVTPEQFEAFRKEMEDAGVDYKIAIYSGAQHAFTNQEADRLGKQFNMPISYNEKADRQSWQDMQNFLDRIYGRNENR